MGSRHSPSPRETPPSPRGWYLRTLGGAGTFYLSGSNASPRGVHGDQEPQLPPHPSGNKVSLPSWVVPEDAEWTLELSLLSGSNKATCQLPSPPPLHYTTSGGLWEAVTRHPSHPGDVEGGQVRNLIFTPNWQQESGTPCPLHPASTMQYQRRPKPEGLGKF